MRPHCRTSKERHGVSIGRHNRGVISVVAESGGGGEASLLSGFQREDHDASRTIRHASIDEQESLSVLNPPWVSCAAERTVHVGKFAFRDTEGGTGKDSAAVVIAAAEDDLPSVRRPARAAGKTTIRVREPQRFVRADQLHTYVALDRVLATPEECNFLPVG